MFIPLHSRSPAVCFSMLRHSSAQTALWQTALERLDAFVFTCVVKNLPYFAAAARTRRFSASGDKKYDLGQPSKL